MAEIWRLPYAKTFQDIVDACIKSGGAFRMLFVFVRFHALGAKAPAPVPKESPGAAAGLVEVVFGAHQPVTNALTFPSLAANADGIAKDWDAVVVSICNTKNGSMPTDAQANDYLGDLKRRIEELLDRIAAHEWTQEEVLHSRAVEVLDAIGTKEARAVLTRWASGDPAAILTREAQKALKQAR